MSTSTAIATREAAAQEIVSQVRSNEFMEQVKQALPSSVSPARFVRATVTALRMNAEVLDADRGTLFSALIRSAQDGLMPDQHEAALVVFGGKVAYLPMIAGYRKIAAEHGWQLRTRVVYENDHFVHEEGLDPKLEHRPVRERGEERGKLYAAYAIATHRDGRRLDPVVLYEADIEKIRKAARGSNSGPWVDWTARMWEKSAGRRLFQELPLSEADRERIDRVLSAEDLGPVESAVEVYGPEARASLAPASPPDLPPGGEGDSTAGTVADASSQEAAATQQAEPPEPAASTVSEEPEPTLFQAPTNVDETPEVVAARLAGEVLIPDGVNEGMPLKALLDAETGEKWLRMALRKDWPEEQAVFEQAAWAFAAVYMPDVHRQVAEEQGRSES